MNTPGQCPAAAQCIRKIPYAIRNPAAAAILGVSALKHAAADPSRDAEKVARAEYRKLCNFYGIRIPTELYDSVPMRGCTENPWAVPQSQIEKETADLWKAVDTLGGDRATELRQQYAKFYGPTALTSAVLREMPLSELCETRHSAAPEDKPDVLQELHRRKPFPANILRLIDDKSIAIGMPEAAVYCSLGRPEHTNRTVYASGAHKQLVYPSGVYVYVENGVVVSWQD